MYIMCVKVIAVPSQDSGRSCILCVLRLSLYQARTVSDHVYMFVKVIAVPSQDSERSCIFISVKVSLYQARTVRGHVYMCVKVIRCTKLGQ